MSESAIWPRHQLAETPSTIPDTDMDDLTDAKQREVYEAVGDLLINMIAATGEVYVTDFVVGLETGELVAYECRVAESVPVTTRMQ